MSENTLPPLIKFHQNHRPAMDTGEYSITINGSISHAKISSSNTAAITRRFAIFGERFTLNDQDVRAVFPAAGSTGQYSRILPHIILNRNTLPWERHAFASNKNLPWLVLLLFDETETPEKKTVTVKELWTPPDGAGRFSALSKEIAQHDDEKLTVIDVPKKVLQKILPSAASLTLLAHTRQGVNDKHELVGEENAVVFCNRLPEQGKRSTLHLVSVEGRYEETGFEYSDGVNLFRLVSLKSWEFYTIEHFKTFDGLLTNLNKDVLTLRLPPNKNPEAEKYLSQGLVPLEHHFRNGDRSASWYRAPFVPFKPGTPADGSAVRDLQPETSDELTQFDAGRGMFDVTYSAAWEIGRLLALASKDFSVSLFHWKRLIAQHQHKARQLTGNEHLPVFAHSHNHELEAPLWEKHLQPWLTQLSAFQSVPANYLVPGEQLLPKESIRFFYVDKNWQVAALSGAFSVGGDRDSDNRSDANVFNDFLNLEDAYLTGFLLRSDVVNGWPGLLIDGVDTKEIKQPPLRRLLSRDVLLCLFKEELKEVVFHQKPEVMHFGLLPGNDRFVKTRRTEEGDETGTPLPVDWQSNAQARVIDMDKLAQILGKDGKPAQFAMNMIEGVPKVRFKVG